jgi:hypothetical protein
VASRRRYTRREKAHAVGEALASSQEAASEKLGIPRRTIGYWMDQPEYADLRHKARDAVADELWTAIQVGIGEVAKGLKGDAPLRDKATAVGILYDKHALLTGMATARTENRDLTGTLSDADLDAAIAAAEAVVRGEAAPAPAGSAEPGDGAERLE